LILPRPTQPTQAVRLRVVAKDVGAVFYDDHTAEIDLANSIAAAKSSVVTTAGYDGKGVHVAVHEDGPTDTTNLELAGRYTNKPKSDKDSEKNEHAWLTHAIVKNIEENRPHGHAPGCKLYSANAETTAALEWALDQDQDCTVISQSYHRGNGPTSPDLQHDDILQDWKATKWPFPTFALASGNFHSGDGKKYVNHKCYNTLKAGSHHDNALKMAATSEYRNPPSLNGDRELPEVAANGTVVGANDQLKSGTSFAAPAVAEVVALIQGMNPRLKRSPEGCRVIILASANRTVVGGTWWGDICAKIDGKAGAGSLDAQYGMDIATQTKCPYCSPSRYGWDIGVLYPDDFDDKGFANALYYVQVPPASKATAASTSYIVKAALTWNSKVTSADGKPTSSELTADLDLCVEDARGTLVALSASFDNNYEIVEFYAKPGDTYELSIYKFSGKPETRYGIAWTVRDMPWDVKRP
jgi:Subtilase family